MVLPKRFNCNDLRFQVLEIILKFKQIIRLITGKRPDILLFIDGFLSIFFVILNYLPFAVNY
ncbi:hypothetical protein SAMN05443549_107102 [Flavobacterium fluvii]|uniref:Uncharacterized protein n=1 Tax=Flavobacterium fluvii TaxID=468056 RepID=A0A1M5N409_9FLAO|nr:hypothetical protein SAMN05443549_107102 [Flavobacterium fluvii]